MFKINLKRKSDTLNFIDRHLYIVDQISDFTAFIYSKVGTAPQVMVYHKNNGAWTRDNIIAWDVAVASRKMLTS